jgi:hypothetical protein
MSRFWKQSVALFALTTAVGLWCFAPSVARSAGGGGADAGATAATRFSVIPLPVLSLDAKAVSNPSGGVVTVVGSGSELGYANAAYARVDVAGRKVIASGLLPEPTDGTPADMGSGAYDVNLSGTIVGFVDISGTVPVRWIRSGPGYKCEPLPLLAGDDDGNVLAINDAGVMVGNCTSSGAFHPACWSADGKTVTALSTYLPDNSGWTLTVAHDINNSGLIVGIGQFQGVQRGFVLDPATRSIAAVPLPPGATTNEAWQINDFGHVIGKADDGIEGGGPYPQGGWGFFWAGPGTEAQLLPATTAGAGIARAVNNADELAGDSHVPGAPWGNGDVFMSLWEPDGSGGFAVTDLGSQVPSKPVWYLRFGYGINNDLWIAGQGRKFEKGKYTWMGVLVVPNP